MVLQKLNHDGLPSIYRQIKIGYVADFSANLVKRTSYYGLFLRVVHFVCKAVRLNRQFEILDASKRLRHAIAKILPSELRSLDKAKRKAVERSLKVELAATAQTFKSAQGWFVQYLFGTSVKESELDNTYDSITRLVRDKAIGGKDRAKYNHQLTREIFKKLLSLDAESVHKLGFPLSYVEKMLQKAFLGLDFTAKGIDWRWHEAQTPLACFKYSHVNLGGSSKEGIDSEISPFAFYALLNYLQSSNDRNLQMTQCQLKSSHCQSLKDYLAKVNKNNGLVLSLAENDIDDAGVEAIVEGVLANPNRDFYLSILDLSNNPKITAKSATAFARLVASGKLRSVSIGGCSINATGKKQILVARSDPSSKLRKIELETIDADLSKYDAPLFYATQKGDIEWMRALLDAKVDIDEKNRDNEWTALHMASAAGQLEVVQLLLDRKADTSAKTKDGFTPLYLAAQNGHDKCIEALLKAKTPINQTNGENETTALHLASCSNRPEVVKLLIDRQANHAIKDKLSSTPLDLAALNGHAECVKALLDGKANIEDKTDDNEWTALHTASAAGHKEVVELLIARGANVSAITKDGFTPLYLAAQNGHVECIKALLNAGSPINQTNGDDDMTALEIASYTGKHEAVQLLINQNATVRTQTRDGFTALFFAAQEGHLDCVKALLDAKALINQKNGEDEWTALHIATSNGKNEVVTLLADRKADLEVLSKDHRSALDIAAGNGNRQMFDLLLNKGANITKLRETKLSDDMQRHILDCKKKTSNAKIN